MILEVAALQVRAGQGSQFEAAFRVAQRIIASMPGYVSHELQRCIERPGHYMLLVRWQSLEAHEVGFRGSAEYQEWKRLLHHFYEPFPVVSHYEAVKDAASATAPGQMAAVMVHVADVEQGLSWYEQAFPNATRRVAPGTTFEFLQVGDVQLELVPSDEKVSAGAAGSVVYWHVPNLEQAIARFASLGAVVYRGPMQIEAKLSMCQVRDPWGNCIGLRGPAVEGEADAEPGDRQTGH